MVDFMRFNIFRKKNAKPEPLVLEYFIVFQKSGLPIFSKCFGDFCSVILVDDIILSGFLSALTTMPKMFGEGHDRLNAVEIGYTTLLFDHTLPNGNIICLGFKKEGFSVEKNELIEDLFKQINDFVEITHKDEQWDFLKRDEIRTILNELLDTIITPWINIDQNYREHGPKCSMSIESDLFRGEDDIGLKQPIWTRLSDVFRKRKEILKDEIPEKRNKLLQRGLLRKKDEN